MLSPIQKATQRATEIYHESGARCRIEKDGYTRVDPFLVAAGEGVTVMLRPLELLLGAFIRQEAAGILVNAERSAGLIHMTCAHELGHYFMGHETTTDERIDYGSSAGDIEQEADWFAYQLLTPRLLLANILRRKGWSVSSLRNPVMAYQLSLRLGISYSAALWSLHRQRLLDRSVVESMLKIHPADIKRGLMGDAPHDARNDVWLLDDGDRSSIIEPRPDDQIIVRTSNHASAGFVWNLDEASSSGFEIKPILQNAQNPVASPELVFGSPPTADYLLSPIGPPSTCGSLTTLDLKELRPWITEAEPAATLELRTQFEELDSGLTLKAKQRLLSEAAAQT